MKSIMKGSDNSRFNSFLFTTKLSDDPFQSNLLVIVVKLKIKKF